MAIKIDKVIDLTNDSLNSSPKLVKNLQIAMEPDASIFQYYISNNRAGDKESDIVLGSYDDLTWCLPATHLTTQKVKNIGIKHFPQVGAIGFFTFLNEERSKILAPIHVKSKKYTAPSINVIENDTTLTIVISPPIDYGVDESDGNDIFDGGDGGTINEKIKYICHRVILRLDQFALEYVTYENTLEVDKPVTTGTYDIYCVGYIHEGEAVSEDSNHVSLHINGTQDTWPGPVEGSDLYITDVEVTAENKVHIRRSDGFQKDSDNVIPVPVSMTFLNDGRLQMTLNTGDTVTSNNVSPGGGGGGTASLYLHAIDRILPTNNTLRVSSDTVLAKDMDKDKFMTSDNVAEISRIDDLTVRVNLAEAAVAGEQISLKANRNAYRNNNGSSEELIIEVPELTFANLLNDYSLMTQIRTNSKADSGSDTITTTLAYPDIDTRTLITSFTLNGDSYAMIGSRSAEVNRRDASIYNSWKQEGSCEGVDFIKLRWNGMSYYGDAVADSTWELYIMTNGDLMIHIVDYPKNTGTCSLFGISFTISKDNPTVSFYRQDYYGSNFKIVQECYDVTKHNPKADEAPGNTIADWCGLYYGDITKIRNNSKNDDGTDTVNFVNFAWHLMTRLIVSGNSWMGKTSSSEDIKFNRRDAASYYIYYQDMNVEDYGGLHAIRIVWGGASHYSSSVDQWWELWLFENGDAMIYCKRLGINASGTSSFYGVSFTPSNGSYHSFYKNGESWIKEDAIYDLSKHVPSASTNITIQSYAVTNGDSGAVASASCEISSGDDSSTLLAFVTTREETTFSDGWEIVHQFDPCYDEGNNVRQIMYVLKKPGSASTSKDKIEVNVAKDSRIYIVMLCLNGVNTLTADNSIFDLPSIDVNSITINKMKEQSIYAIQAITVSDPTLNISPNDDCLIIPCGYRLWVIVDISKTFTHTCTLSSTVTGLQANVIGIE